MNKSRKFINYGLWNLAFIIALYLAIGKEIVIAKYAIVGFLWFEFLVLWFFSASSKAFEFLKISNKTNPIFFMTTPLLVTVDLAFDFIILSVLFLNGWHLSSVVYLLHMILGNYLKFSLSK